MGVDLRIHLDRHRFGLIPQWGGFNELHFDQEYPLFEQFSTYDPPGQIRVRPRPVPDTFSMQFYSEEGLLHTNTDDHGDPLTWCTVGELATLQAAVPWNRAILAMLRELPTDMIAVLNWSW